MFFYFETRMILLLARNNDPVADALQQRLSSESSFLRVSPEELVFAPVWVNEISESGVSSVRIRLANGKEILSADVKAAYNRILRLDAIHFLDEVDRNYGSLEFTALFYSLMQSLNNALLLPFNISQMQADHLSEWVIKSAAIDVGLPVTDLELSSSPRWQKLSGLIPYMTERNHADGFYHQAEHLVWTNKPLMQQQKFLSVFSVFVVGDKVFSENDLPFKNELHKLAAHFGSPYMEVKIAEQSEGAFFVYECNICPDKIHAKAIDVLAQALLQKNRQLA
jgi:hypothetical protein